MPTLSLIANSGIQTYSFTIKIKEAKKPMLFHEWYDRDDCMHKLDVAYEIPTEHEPVYVRKKELGIKGYLNANAEMDWNLIRRDNVKPLKIGERMANGVEGEIFKMDFNDRHSKLKKLENVWLPVPYFFNQTERRQLFGPLNWSRFKLIPRGKEENCLIYDVVLAFDTRTVTGDSDEYNECPVFKENCCMELEFSVCKTNPQNEFFIVDYCLPDKSWSYIDNYIRRLVHPDISDIRELKSQEFKCSYIASYIYLINTISEQGLFPDVVMHRDRDGEAMAKEIDMIVDVGNSKTTVLLVENNNFNDRESLRLQDYTDIVKTVESKEGTAAVLNQYDEPFDMRVAFRRADFGRLGIEGSRQFVYPSLVRLGKEANNLIHAAVAHNSGRESVSTNSSPKRYLWDNKKSRVNWEFVVLPGENKDDSILTLPGITNQLNSDGTLDPDGKGGQSYKYSRRSLMTFSFLEMIVQAHIQVNSVEYRKVRGAQTLPRRLKRIIITCPTTMSKVERSALIRSARDAVVMFDNFGYKDVSENINPGANIEVVPATSNQVYKWYYDEATCAQFVYIYAEIAKRYGCYCNEFFRLYGRKRDGEQRESLIVGSLDIGAGTSDLMISKYNYTDDGIVSISPDPLFYDSFYYAGDDMVRMLIRNIMIEGRNSALRTALKHLSQPEYNALVTSFFGPDYPGQPFDERLMRRDFALQASVPFIQFFLQLMQKDEKHRFVSYDEIFREQQPGPNERLLEHFLRHFGVDFRNLEWEFDMEHVGELIERAFDENLIKQVAAIMYAYSCDIVILSGRPTSLPPIERLFLKYYTVAPNRLILLNKFQVGNWYPFNDHNGYMSNPKAIVAVGAMIGYYASELAILKDFTLDLGKLGSNLKSTVNYLLNPNLLENSRFFMKKGESAGTVMTNSLPTIIDVKQLDLPSYPAKSLFTIDFNRENISAGIWARAEQENTEPTQAAVDEQVEDRILRIRHSLPLRFDVARGSSPDEKEALRIVAVEDREGKTLPASYFEISIQSLGVSESYWLDTGIII